MRRVKVLIIIIILSIIYLTINVNSAFMIDKSNPMISAYKNENLLRLHVLANSNSPKDQYVKRRVRDEVSRYIKISKETDNNNLDNKIKDIEKMVNQFLDKENINYKARVELGKYDFPKRTYGNIQLPSGEYKAIKITLGKGKGANWWCVLLPPVCVETEEEIQLEKQKLEEVENKNIISSNLIKFKLKSAEIVDFHKLKRIKFLKDKIKTNILKPEFLK
ncbi:MAG: stage II sporulation protein R [Bacillota bacterium]